MQFEDVFVLIIFRILILKFSYSYFILQYVVSIYKTSALGFFPGIFLKIYNFVSVVVFAVFSILPANFKWRKRRKFFIELRYFLNPLLEKNC